MDRTGPGGFQVSVNISPVQFKKEGNHQEQAWLDYLSELGLSGESIVLEITEGLLLDENTKIANKLRKYREAGVQMAIDDFGTGYSSLSYLKKLDIDYLKIDKSFVSNLATDPNDMALSEVIIVMAHKLGLKAIVESVKTEAQRSYLAGAGCDYAKVACSTSRYRRSNLKDCCNAVFHRISRIKHRAMNLGILNHSQKMHDNRNAGCQKDAISDRGDFGVHGTRRVQ